MPLRTRRRCAQTGGSVVKHLPRQHRPRREREPDPMDPGSRHRPTYAPPFPVAHPSLTGSRQPRDVGSLRHLTPVRPSKPPWQRLRFGGLRIRPHVGGTQYGAWSILTLCRRFLVQFVADFAPCQRNRFLGVYSLFECVSTVWRHISHVSEYQIDTAPSSGCTKMYGIISIYCTRFVSS